jgi:hypothetical protein
LQVPLLSRALPQTGYVVIRDDHGGHAVLDAGPHGFANGGHAHADALAITLTVGNRPLLVDPGTGTYTMNAALRDKMRSSMNHNTVTVDGRTQSVPAGPFSWKTQAHGRLSAWRSNHAFDWALAVHDGYAPVGHSRALLRTRDSGWLIVDVVTGDGFHTASAHWHFDPAWALTRDEPGRILASHQDGDRVWLLHDGGTATIGRGNRSTDGMGWCAPVYGRIVPSWTLKVTQAGMARMTFLTWIHPEGSAIESPPVLERMSAAREGADHFVAARVSTGRAVSTFLLRDDETETGRLCHVGGCSTDARVLHFSESANRVLTLDLVDVSEAAVGGWSGVSLASADVMPDLHMTLGSGGLRLYAAQPPSTLRMRGEALRRVISVRLNGRDIRRPAADSPNELTIQGGEWGEMGRQAVPLAGGRDVWNSRDRHPRLPRAR